MYLKYRFLRKNILNLKKKIYIKNQWKLRCRFQNFLYKKYKFWRPKFITFSQIGNYTCKWLKTGLTMNIPIFFFPPKIRLSLKKLLYRSRFIRRKLNKNSLKQYRKNNFIKKSKLQILKLYFMKLIIERNLRKIFNFPIFCNFRLLILMNKKLKRLRVSQSIVYEDCFFFHRDELFRRSVSLFAFGFYFGNSKLIAQQVAIRITRTRKHWRTLKQLKKTLHYLRLILPETSGFQIDVYGKIGAKTRTKFFRMTSGKLPQVQTLATRVHYTFQESYSFTGVFGIHVWLCTAF